MKKPATKEEQEFMGRVVGLGCIVCGRPACFHHIRFGQGRAMRSSNKLGLPLCDSPPDGHHKNGPHGTAFHAGQKAFENRFGTEIELLEKVYKRLKLPWPPKELTDLVDSQKVGYRIGFKTNAKSIP